MQNNTPCVWWSEDGKRLGTFDGHNGAVWSCDITCAPPSDTADYDLGVAPALLPTPVS